MLQSPRLRLFGVRSVLGVALSISLLSMAALPFVGCGEDSDSKGKTASGGATGTGSTTSGGATGTGATGSGAASGTGGLGGSSGGCVEGEECGEDGICHAGKCETCGNPNQDCCDGGDRCVEGSLCQRFEEKGVCQPCVDGDVCCDYEMCAGGEACVFDAGDGFAGGPSVTFGWCHAECGGDGQDCCKNDQCGLGFSCDGGTCVANGCGEYDNICCANNRCGTGLACFEGFCI